MHIGVDTHKKRHVLVALDARGQTCGTQSVANTPAGWAAALQWARERDAACVWGVENSGSLGKGFAQFLLTSGESAVHEIVPHRTAKYRKRGRNQDKTDHTDALAMARLLQAEGEHLPLVERDDVSTELRLLSDHRDNLVAERTRLVNQLHAQMLQIDPCYAERSGTLTSRTGIRYCQALDLPHAEANGSPPWSIRLLRSGTNSVSDSGTANRRKRRQGHPTGHVNHMHCVLPMSINRPPRRYR